MDFGADDRGVSEVIGFILVFSFLVTAFTIYQGLVVPEQNRQVEFQHNQEVQGDLQDLRNAIVTTAATGTGQSVSIEMGATYPSRTIAQNLGFSAGAIRTGEPESLRIDNASALDSETRDYLNGSQTFQTQSIRYNPVYSFYSSAPETIYENTLVFNRFAEENLTVTDQTLIDGRRITVVAINGSLDAARRGTLSVSPEAISASSNRVAIENTSAGPVNLTVPTELSATKWQEILDDELNTTAGTNADGYVENVTPVAGASAVRIELKRDVVYELRMAKVGVGSSTAEEGPAYIIDVSGNGTSVPEGGSQKLVVEVRDRFNNPVSSVSVFNTSTVAGNVTPNNRTTDSAGRATFTYEAPEDVNSIVDEEVTIEFDGDGTANESVAFQLEVLDSDGSGGGGGGGGGDDGDDVNEVNPGDTSGDVIWVSASRGGPNNEADVTFNNTGSTRHIERVRIPFYYEDNDPENAPDSAEFFDTTGTSVGTIEISRPIESLDSPITLTGGGTESTFTIEFTTQGGNDPQTRRDFFILVLEFDDGSQSTYFISVSQ